MLRTDFADIIIDSQVKWDGKKLERNYKVLKLLKKLGIETLENNFDSVYAHTLMEYAADAGPVELVHFFAAKEIKDSFEKALYKDNKTEFYKIIAGPTSPSL